MLDYLCEVTTSVYGYPSETARKPSERKLRLFVEAWRTIFDIRSKPAYLVPLDLDEQNMLEMAIDCAGHWHEVIPMAECSSLLREIVGNPFRPVELETEPWCSKCGFNPRTRSEHTICAVCHEWIVQKCPWLTPDVLAIAQRIHDDRDFDAMPFLADALEEAGCTEETILRHLRGEEMCSCSDGIAGYSVPRDPTRFSEKQERTPLLCAICGGCGWIPLRCPHVRGCFAIDLILNLE